MRVYVQTLTETCKEGRHPTVKRQKFQKQEASIPFNKDCLATMNFTMETGFSEGGGCARVVKPPWPNGQGVGLLIRRLRVRVPQGVRSTTAFFCYSFLWSA